jgi:hypothetical protein
MGKIKERSLNELRQEKEYGYQAPLSHAEKNLENCTQIYSDIRTLAKKYPNDMDLGKKVRSYLIELGLYE